MWRTEPTRRVKADCTERLSMAPPHARGASHSSPRRLPHVAAILYAATCWRSVPRAPVQRMCASPSLRCRMDLQVRATHQMDVPRTAGWFLALARSCQPQTSAPAIPN